jgi:FtsP/CotA-like multicopper oxidase with cupredoxin domain
MDRRAFLKGSVLAGAAVALGRLPSMPAAPVPVAAAAVPPVAPVVTRMETHVMVSDEMLQDAAALNDYITRRMTEAFARREEEYMRTGAG